MRVLRSLLLAFAVFFAAGSTFYSICWIYYVRLQPGVLLGINHEAYPEGQARRISISLVPGSGGRR